jgi:uncharacterized protein (DUF362 family)
MSTVAITQNDNIEHAVEQALGHMSGLESLIGGKLVAVKVNETWASESDTTGVCQPDTLRAVLRYVKRHQPRHIVVSGGAGAAETDEVFRYAGLTPVVEEEGVEFFDHNRAPFEEIELAYGPDREVQGPQQKVMINPRVLEYEALIVVSQIKLHRTATVTMALKNIAMSFPAADYYGHPRGEYRRPHHFFDDMHSFIAAMARRFPIDLAINVGHPAMIATGPLGGVPVETGIVIASRDSVAANVVGAKLLGFHLQGVRHLWEAAKIGLGEGDVDKMDFPAMGPIEAIEAFTERAYGRRMTYVTA